MLIKKKRKAIAAVLSAMCSVTSINAKEKNVTISGTASQQNNTKPSRAKSAALGQKSNLGLKPGVTDFVSKHAGALSLGAATLAGLVVNAKPGYDVYKERSENIKLKNSESNRENLKKQIEESNQRESDLNKDILDSTKSTIASEALVFSTDKKSGHSCKITKDSLLFADKELKDFANLKKLKKDKYEQDDKKKTELLESLEKLSNSLKTIIFNLSTNSKFTDKLKSSLSTLKPENGDGIINLVKTLLKSVEEAWCAVDLHDLDSDDDKYNKLNTNKARLEYFIDGYLNLLLPIGKDDMDSDGLPKNDNTRMAVAFSYLFYKESTEKQLTIDQFIKNSFGDSIFVSKLATRLQNIRNAFVPVEYIPNVQTALQRFSPKLHNRVENFLNDKLSSSPVGVDMPKNLLFSIPTKLLFDLGTISISDASFKNLLGSCVKQGVKNDLLPENCLQFVNTFTVDNIEKLPTLMFSQMDKLNTHDGVAKLLQNNENPDSPDPSENILKWIDYMLPEKKNDEKPKETATHVLDTFILSDDNIKKLYESLKIDEKAEQYKTRKTLTEKFIKDKDEKLYVSLNDLNKNWTELNLEDLKTVTDWNCYYVCYAPKPLLAYLLGGKNKLEYNSDSDNYKNAKAAYERLKSKFKDNLKLDFVEPGTAKIWHDGNAFIEIPKEGD